MDEVLADFIRVELDSKELTKDKNFAVKDGSIIVTLIPEFVGICRLENILLKLRHRAE